VRRRLGVAALATLVAVAVAASSSLVAPGPDVPDAAAVGSPTSSTPTTGTGTTTTALSGLLLQWVRAYGPVLNAVNQDTAAVVVFAAERPIPVTAVARQCAHMKADVTVAARAGAVPVKSLQSQWKALLTEARLLVVRCTAAVKRRFATRRWTRPFNAVADSMVTDGRAMVAALVKRGAAPGQYAAAHATG